MSTEGHERVEAEDNRPELMAVEYDGWVTYSEQFSESMTEWISIAESDRMEAVDLVEGEE